MSQTVRCKCCGGSGKQEVSEAYEDVLDVMKGFERPVTIGEVLKAMDRNGKLNGFSKATLLHKRLERMESLGLVKRVGRKESSEDKRRRSWLFEIV
jgi:DNA-binding HxlR family transcriptional regulator